jgi:TATA-box binding protein (TBP) (component of TFIID and TFIIIB)
MLSFDEIKISTKTIIARTNFKFNLEELFNILPVTEYNISTKKRGRRAKNTPVFEASKIKDGDIITLKLGEKVRGVVLKNKKSDKVKKYFRNNLTIVMQTENKLLNIKISRNGVLQATGAKNDDNMQMFIEKIKYHVDNYKGDAKNALSVFCNSDPYAILIPAMTNINFSLGFHVNRENLDNYINNNTNYYSILETSFGYTGINIKMPLLNEKVGNINLRKINFKDDKWNQQDLIYSDYINSLSQSDQLKEKNKIRYCTVLVFQSGNAILSSIHKDCMKDAYNEFMEIIRKCQHLIEEK